MYCTVRTVCVSGAAVLALNKILCCGIRHNLPDDRQFSDKTDARGEENTLLVPKKVKLQMASEKDIISTYFLMNGGWTFPLNYARTRTGPNQCEALDHATSFFLPCTVQDKYW